MKNFKLFHRLHAVFFGLVLGIILLVQPAHAQTTGFNQPGAGPHDYDTSGNWVGGTINGIWDSTLTLTAAQVVTFDSDLSLGTGLTFNYTGNFALNLRGDGTDRTITLGGNIGVGPVSNQTVTLGSVTGGQNLNVDLGAATRTFTVNASKTLTVVNSVSNGSIIKAGGGNLNLQGTNSLGTLSVTAGGTTTLGGSTTLSGAASLSLGTLTISGTLNTSSGINQSGGTLNLNAAQSYTGDTTITGGTANVAAAGTLGDNVAGNDVAVSGAILNLAAAANIGGNQALSVGSTSTTLGVLGLAFNSLPNLTQSSADPIIIGVNTTGFTAISSQSSVGNGNIFLGSTGTGTFAGASLAAGTGGVYRLGGGGGTLTVTNGVLSGANSLVVGSTLTNGGGTVVLGAANSYTGLTTVAVGSTLRLSDASGAFTSAATITGGGTLNFNSGTTGGGTRAPALSLNQVTLSVTGNSTSDTIDTITNALTFNGDNADGFSIVQISPNASQNARLSAGSLARGTPGAVAFFRGDNLGINTITSQTNGSSNIQFTAAPTLLGGGDTSGTKISIIPWAAGAPTAGGGVSTFVTYSATNGIRPLNTGTEFVTTLAAAAATDNVRVTATEALGGATTINSLIVQPGAAITISGGSLNVTSGAILINPSGDSDVTTIASDINFGTAQGVIGVSSNRETNITGAVSGSGGLVIYSVSSGGGAVDITGGNVNSSTYTGDTYLLSDVETYTGGSLFFPNGGRTGDMYVYGDWDLADGTIINGLNGNGTVDWGHSNTAGLTLGDNNADGTFTGQIQSAASFNQLAVTKIGAGTQILSGGTSNYSRFTAIKGGVLSVTTLADGGNTSSIGRSSNSAANLVLNGGTLRYTGVATETDRLFQIGESTTGATGTIDASGTGAMNFDNPGSIAYGTAGTTGTAQTRTLVLTGTNTGSNTIAAVIGNNGAAVNGNSAVSVTKNGTGSWTLSGTNTYTGTTTISAGTLVLSGSGSINNTSGTSVAATATLTNNSSVAYNKALTLAEGAVIGGTGSFEPTAMTLTANLADGFIPFALGTTGLTKAFNLELTLSGLATGNYTLFTGSALGGAFDTLTVGGTALTPGGGGDFSGTVLGTAYTFTNANNLLAITVPEPSTWALLAFSLTTALVLRRRV